MITLGFDPGGQRKFGCAIAEFDDGARSGRLLASCDVSSVDEAMAWVTGQVSGRKIEAVGIDTLLFWQSTASGWRGADEWLKTNYRDVALSIVSSNGLYGAMSVQGALLAKRLRDEFPSALITETHPKVLWRHFDNENAYPRDWPLCEGAAIEWLANRGLHDCSFKTDHQFDAAMSAWAAAQGFAKNWNVDLFDVVARQQVAPNVTVCSDVCYLWPGELA